MKKDKDITNVINFPKKKSKLEREIEAIIFASDEPLDLDTIEKRVGSSFSYVLSLHSLIKTRSIIFGIKAVGKHVIDCFQTFLKTKYPTSFRA